MPAAAWVAIGVFIAGCLWTALWWAVRKQFDRITAIEKHLHEPGGVLHDNCKELRSAIAKCIAEEDLDMTLKPFTDELRRITQEGRDREERLMEALANQSAEMREGQKSIRSDISGIHGRIDGIYDNRHRGGN